jgi:hypothetical protein
VNLAKGITMGTSSTRRSIRFGRRQEGQSVVEFMLMLPFFLIFILLVIEFGLFMWTSVSIANATREGARFASANCGGAGCGDGLDIIERVKLRAGDGIGLTDDDITVSWPDGRGRGDPVSVAIDYSHQLFFIPGIMSFFNSDGQTGIPIRSCSDMRLEQNEGGDPTGVGCQG